MIRYALIFIAMVAFVSACTTRQPEEQCAYVPDVSNVTVDLQIEQYQDVLPNLTSKQELVDFFTAHPDLRDVFFNRPAYPNDSVFINSLYNKFTNPAIDTVLLDVHRVFGDLSELKSELTQAFQNMKYYYPDFKAPKVKTIITALETDIFVSDTLVIVGLDYFLGNGAKYRPNMYEYMVRRYQKNFIVPSMLLLYGIDQRYNMTSLEDHTALADMVAYGKAYYFAKHMLPCVPDSVFIGYTAEEMAGSKQFEDLIWKRMVEDEVFFSTSHMVKQRYIAERPKTLEVGEKCPGRIGTWVGWQIVRKYAAEHPDESLPQVMGFVDPQQLFRASKYKPGA